MQTVLAMAGPPDPNLFVRFPASLRGDLGGLPARFVAGMASATEDTLTWRPKRGLRRRNAGFDLAVLQLRQVRDTVPTEVLRLDRSCRVFEFDYLGGSVSVAVQPDELPMMWAVLGRARP